MFNFDMKKMMNQFMPATLNDEVAFTMDGHTAVKATDGNYYYYNGEMLINAYEMTLPINGMAFLMPVQQITENDIIKLKDTFYHITKVNAKSINAVSLSSGRDSSIKLTKDMFGNQTYQKVVNMMGMMNGNAQMNGMNPMGGMNPMAMMMMSQMFGKDENEGNDSSDSSPFEDMFKMQMMMGMMMGNGNQMTSPMMGMNPMMGMFGGMNGMNQPQMTQTQTEE